jgi:hypothetical protein
MAQAAKDKYVHPRTGFVSFTRRKAHRWATGALAFVISALMALLISRSPVLRNAIPALQGTVFAVGFFYWGRKVDLLRFSVEGLLCAVVGIVVSVVRLDANVAAAILFGWLGLVLAAGGLVAFIGYVRHSPRREQP